MKHTFLFFIVLLMTVGTYAQEQTVQNQERDNWYISANVGAQVFNGKNDSKESFGNRLAPVGGITGGKWLNNWLAVDGNLSLAQFKGLYNTSKSANFETLDVFSNVLDQQRGTYMHFHVDAKFDVLAMKKDFNPENQKHSLLPYVGLGGAVVTSKGSGAAFTMNAGIQYRYHIKPNLSLQADFSNYFLTKGIEGEECDEHTFHYVGGLTLGVVYTFGQKSSSNK